MRGGVGMVIGLDFDDYPTDAIEKESCTDKLGRNDVDAAGEESAGEGGHQARLIWLATRLFVARIEPRACAKRSPKAKSG